MIKFFGLDRQYQCLKEEILHTTNEVLRSGQLLDGPYVKKFVSAVAERCNRTYAIAVNSCTQALEFVQHCHQYKSKKIANQVLIPNISFIATLNSTIRVGNQPVFCDTDSQGLMDLESFEHNLNQHGIDSIMYVNLFGNIIDYHKFINFTKFFNPNIFIIEDAAQSFGGSYNNIPSGKLGDVSCLSFDPTKNLANYGSGGMILLDDFEMYLYLINLRDNGKPSQYSICGTNSKMSELDSAHMLIKLKYFDQWQQRREDIANYYSKELCEIVQTPHISPNIKHAWHKYVIRYHDRSALQQQLIENNIDSKIHYTSTLHSTDLGINYANIQYSHMPSSTQFTKECLSLPIYPELLDAEVEKIVDVIKSYIL